MNQPGWKSELVRQLRQPVRARVWALVLPAFAVYVMLLWVGYKGMPTSQRFSQSVHGLITVQTEIEHWTAGSQKFPLRIEPLMASLDIRRVPANWYRRGRRSTIPMRLVELGSADFTGNYSYIPVLDGDEVVGYYLLVYGNQLTPGMDVDNDGRPDHVVHVLSSLNVRGNLWGCWPGRDEQLPPLEDAIARWRDFRADNGELWHDSARQLTTLHRPGQSGTTV